MCFCVSVCVGVCVFAHFCVLLFVCLFDGRLSHADVAVATAAVEAFRLGVCFDLCLCFIAFYFVFVIVFEACFVLNCFRV